MNIKGLCHQFFVVALLLGRSIFSQETDEYYLQSARSAGMNAYQDVLAVANSGTELTDSNGNIVTIDPEEFLEVLEIVTDPEQLSWSPEKRYFRTQPIVSFTYYSDEGVQATSFVTAKNFPDHLGKDLTLLLNSTHWDEIGRLPHDEKEIVEKGMMLHEVFSIMHRSPSTNPDRDYFVTSQVLRLTNKIEFAAEGGTSSGGGNYHALRDRLCVASEQVSESPMEGKTVGQLKMELDEVREKLFSMSVDDPRFSMLREAYNDLRDALIRAALHEDERLSNQMDNLVEQEPLISRVDTFAERNVSVTSKVNSEICAEVQLIAADLSNIQEATAHHRRFEKLLLTYCQDPQTPIEKVLAGNQAVYSKIRGVLNGAARSLRLPRSVVNDARALRRDVTLTFMSGERI